MYITRTRALPFKSRRRRRVVARGETFTFIVLCTAAYNIIKSIFIFGPSGSARWITYTQIAGHKSIHAELVAYHVPRRNNNTIIMILYYYYYTPHRGNEVQNAPIVYGCHSPPENHETFRIIPSSPPPPSNHTTIHRNCRRYVVITHYNINVYRGWLTGVSGRY